MVGLLTGFGITVFIDTTQLMLPGCHSSLADLLWNSIGAGLGPVMLVPIRDRTTRTGRRLGRVRRFRPTPKSTLGLRIHPVVMW